MSSPKLEASLYSATQLTAMLDDKNVKNTTESKPQSIQEKSERKVTFNEFESEDMFGGTGEDDLFLQISDSEFKSKSKLDKINGKFFNI